MRNEWDDYCGLQPRPGRRELEPRARKSETHIPDDLAHHAMRRGQYPEALSGTGIAPDERDGQYMGPERATAPT